MVMTPDEKRELLMKYKLKENQLMRIQGHNSIGKLIARRLRCGFKLDSFLPAAKPAGQWMIIGSFFRKLYQLLVDMALLILYKVVRHEKL